MADTCPRCGLAGNKLVGHVIDGEECSRAQVKQLKLDLTASTRAIIRLNATIDTLRTEKEQQ